MPFTFSHPAIVLPLTKYSGRYISLTGLIIGSMTPDFEYFFRMKIQSNFSHTIGGLFYFDLPVGLILAFIFHNIIRNSLYDNLPKSFRKRLQYFKTFNWNNYFRKHYLVVIISILLGAITHLVRDSFTHIHGFFVQTFSILQTSNDIGGHNIPTYKILQHSSTLFGGLFIALAFYQLPTSSVNEQKVSIRYWTILIAIILTIVLFRLFYGIDKNFVGQLIGTLINAILISLVVTPYLTQTRKI